MQKAPFRLPAGAWLDLLVLHGGKLMLKSAAAYGAVCLRAAS